MNPSKTLIGASLFVLVLLAGFNATDTSTTHGYRAQISQLASIEAELVETRQQNTDLEAKLCDNEAEIARLLNRMQDAEKRLAASCDLLPPPKAELQAKLDDTLRLLDVAEQEKSVLSNAIKSDREPSTKAERAKKKRIPTGGEPGIRGTVLAVNRTYNFVVLNLGSQQGVEANSEMLVWRDGSLVGKIRISSVEPTMAIGDMISTNLAPSIQVQTGDTVIYAGTNF